MEEIYSRRSIRKYTGKQISEEDVAELLKAAMYAPSACNEQPWHFIVIRGRNMLNAIADSNPSAQMLREAQLAILVCGDLQLEIAPGYFVQDCSAATQNILLTIEEKGMGGVWLGIYPVEERVMKLRSFLNIPEHVVPLSLISVGYPAEKREKDDRFKTDRIHYEKW